MHISEQNRQLRIEKQIFKADDIKHSHVLTDNQICDIPIEKVYEWTKTGKWKQKDFKKWLKALRVIE